MREIKFRAYGKDKKRFSYYIMQSENNKYQKGVWFYFNEKGIAIIDESISDNTEKEQFTGLKDKNGKDIYEGDIIQQDHSGYKMEIKHKERCYNGGNSFWRTIGFIVPDGINQDTGRPCFEIIGNIHENPELIP